MYADQVSEEFNMVKKPNPKKINRVEMNNNLFGK